MTDPTVQLKQIRVPLEDLYLDPNNPRFAKSLNLADSIPDQKIKGEQGRVQKLFVNEQESEINTNDEESDADEGAVRIGDLVRSMDEIGFVPIDQVVVRRLASDSSEFVVIEGNRRVRAAKYVRERLSDRLAADRKPNHLEILESLRELDVLLLEVAGLTEEEIHGQIGVILGLRHFGQVLGWGVLAKAVNIFNEYRLTEPKQETFKLEARRISSVVTRLSETRSGVTNALKTYIAYQQLQEAFPHGQPKPSHYSLIQACVTNRKLSTAGFIQQDESTFDLSAPSLERLNTICEFEQRDSLRDEEKVLRDPKAVSPFSALVSDSASNADSAIRAFATSLRDEVVGKERSLTDAVNNLRSFKSNRAWTESLKALLAKVVEPGSECASDSRQLLLEDFEAEGNELMQLEEARKAFKNVRRILDV